MQYALANSLSSSVSGLDPSAKAYINAITTAGASVTPAKKNLINNFIKLEKANGNWSLHKRIFLPIWANAAANAICLKEAISRGTWINSPTMAAGYVQGNGTNQAFSITGTPSGMGLTTSDAGIWALINQADSRPTTVIEYIGGASGGGTLRFRKTTSNVLNFTVGAVLLSQVLANASQTGILSGHRAGTTSTIYRRTTSGGSVVVGTTTVASSGTLPTNGIAVMAVDVGGTYVNNTDARFGAFGISQGMTQTQNDNFTLNLKTLWEGCTGLVLP